MNPKGSKIHSRGLSEAIPPDSVKNASRPRQGSKNLPKIFDTFLIRPIGTEEEEGISGSRWVGEPYPAYSPGELSGKE